MSLLEKTRNKLEVIKRARTESFYDSVLAQEFIVVLSDVFQYYEDREEILSRMQECIQSEVDCLTEEEIK